MGRRHKLCAFDRELVESDVSCGYTVKTVAERYGVDDQVVYRIMRKGGIPRRRWVKWTPEEDALIREYYPEHGGAWRGWAKLLPGREHLHITKRASTLKVKYTKYGSKK